MDIKGKVVLITGASSGIGSHTSMDMAARGAVIVMLAKDKNKLERG